ncbi:MAG: histidinol dehydrogenase [Immundisolibacteraceae bacterium]|nr:histidinol dehydrogenase [Immundisolibacteraceae bacterium]
MATISVLASSDVEFETQLNDLLADRGAGDQQALAVAADVIERIRLDGDQALVNYTAQFDRFTVENPTELKISTDRIDQALQSMDAELRRALEQAAQRIKAYHQHQLSESWQFTDSLGNQLGQRITPLECIGVYVPGGKAAYPSTVLMNVIPAKVAGVEKIVMVSPTPDGVINEVVLGAAAIAGVDEVYAIGGAQAVAALAIGTQSVPAVDKIVGPGNRYVAAAKQLLFGQVGIDMIAGPSEILIISDATTDPDWVAMDLFSQAEHDEIAQVILITADGEHLQAVEAAIQKLLPLQERADIITAALRDHGALIKVEDLDQAALLANRIAPEHLQLCIEDPDSLLPKIRHAGAIFVGRYSSESLGDYCAGPNHVLPTSGTARFSSALGVYDFQKRTSVIRASQRGAAELGEIAGVMADAEGLASHAAAARYRRPG